MIFLTENSIEVLVETLRKQRVTKKIVAAEGTIRKRISRAGGTPIIQGDIAHFFFDLDSDADIRIVGDWNKWNGEADRLERIHPKSSLYYYQRTFPIDARLSYRLSIDGNMSINDPNNPHSLQEVFGTNTYLRMPGYRGVPYIKDPLVDVACGKIIEFNVKGTTDIALRTVHAYIPNGLKMRGAIRFLYVNDGTQTLHIGKFVNVLDNMYHNEPLTPKTIVVFVPPVHRHEEYMMNRKFSRWFATSLVRQVEKKLRATSKPMLRTVHGASLGALCAMHIGLYHSNVFHNVAAQSPSFWIEDYEMVKQVAAKRKPPLRIYMQTGTINDALDGSRAMLGILEEKGYDVTYRESNESHNWANWSARYAEIIRWSCAA